MPRISRQYTSTKVYHIILRGIDKQDIFFEDMDYKMFLKILKEEQSKYQYEIYVYCLMSNHIHLVIYDLNNELSKIIQTIAIKYSLYFNKKYERIGHLFQNRFLSKAVEDRVYFKNLCRYIHKNPQKAGIDKIENYKWSSYQEYIGKAKIINPKLVIDIFGNKEEFIKFHNIEQYEQEIIDISKYDIDEKIDDKQLIDYICKITEMENITKIAKLSKSKRDKILVKCKNINGVSNRQLARVIGISRKMIDRAN